MRLYGIVGRDPEDNPIIEYVYTEMPESDDSEIVMYTDEEGVSVYLDGILEDDNWHIFEGTLSEEGYIVDGKFMDEYEFDDKDLDYRKYSAATQYTTWKNGKIVNTKVEEL